MALFGPGAADSIVENSSGARASGDRPQDLDNVVDDCPGSRPDLYRSRPMESIGAAFDPSRLSRMAFAVASPESGCRAADRWAACAFPGVVCRMRSPRSPRSPHPALAAPRLAAPTPRCARHTAPRRAHTAPTPRCARHTALRSPHRAHRTAPHCVRPTAPATPRLAALRHDPGSKPERRPVGPRPARGRSELPAPPRGWFITSQVMATPPRAA